MDAIRDKHQGLIKGLTTLYDTFVTMQYISASDVMRPPHTNPEIAIAHLQELGFENEVVNLVQILPALRNEVTWGFQEEGTEIMPRSKAVNYFNSPDGAREELMDDLRRGDFYVWEEAVVLHPRMLRLTDGGDYGTHLIYNTRDQTITEWAFASKKYWYDIPSRPCETVLSEIQAKFESLEWVPHYDPFDERTPPCRRIEENPAVIQNIWYCGLPVPLEVHAAYQKIVEFFPDSGVYFRRRINSWRAQQTLYRDCGWGSADGFDAETFRTRKLDFVTRLRDLEQQQFDLGRGPPETEDQQRRTDELNRRYHDFLVGIAGDNAV